MIVCCLQPHIDLYAFLLIILKLQFILIFVIKDESEAKIEPRQTSGPIAIEELK